LPPSAIALRPFHGSPFHGGPSPFLRTPKSNGGGRTPSPPGPGQEGSPARGGRLPGDSSRGNEEQRRRPAAPPPPGTRRAEAPPNDIPSGRLRRQTPLPLVAAT